MSTELQKDWWNVLFLLGQLFKLVRVITSRTSAGRKLSHSCAALEQLQPTLTAKENVQP